MVTIGDVAKYAGVSRSTVSHALSGKRTISLATRERVNEAVRALNYRANAGARALATARAMILALVVPFTPEEFAPATLQYVLVITQTARRLGYDVLLVTQEEGAEGIMRVAESNLVDGVVVLDVMRHDARAAILSAIRQPGVLIGMPDDEFTVDCVDLDFAAAGRLCVEHLAQLGHRTVAFIGAAEGVYRRHIGFAQRTLRGIREGAAAYGVDLVHRPCDGTFEAAAGALARILEERPGTTGLIVQNEGIIPPLMSLLRAAGRVVPEDVSIVALCPDQLAEQTAPRLTSVTIPAAELGTQAVDLLMRRMADGAAGEVRLIPPSLTVRGSTAPAALSPASVPLTPTTQLKSRRLRG